ncbi:hypothetical protein ACFV30_14310 [Streptomyces sp. NPDC059752]|uniref:hypothetical protein n=1 Tax=unclassified Streptomyces TaxID=2593676 RepID=UPI00365E1B6A
MLTTQVPAMTDSMLRSFMAIGSGAGLDRPELDRPELARTAFRRTAPPPRSQTFFGTKWGWMHKVVDLPSTAYLGVIVVGLALIAVGVKTRKAPERPEAA